MTNGKQGAIDRDFDESERSARDQIEGALADHNRTIAPGDIAIDLVYHRPLFVRRRVAESCVAYWEDGRDFDLTTYKVHPYLPVTPDDGVFECVYVPTKPGDIKAYPTGNTYDFPSGRLARVPIEHLWNSDTRYQDDQKAAFLAALFDASVSGDREGAYGVVLAVVEDVFGDDVIDDALDRSGVELAGDDGDGELGDFDAGAD